MSEDFSDVNLKLVFVYYECPDCKQRSKKMLFTNTKEYQKLAEDPDVLADYLDLHIAFDAMEDLEDGNAVSFTICRPCDGYLCTYENRVQQLNDAIKVPKNFRDVAPSEDLSMLNKYGTLLTGNVGVGKTHHSVAMLKRWLLSNPIDPSYMFINMCELLFGMHNEFGNRPAVPLLQKCMHADLLVLDDIGTEKFSEWSTSQMYLLINYRHDNQKPTIATSNLTLDEIASQFNQRIASRLSSYVLVDVSGEDKRG